MLVPNISSIQNNVLDQPVQVHSNGLEDISSGSLSQISRSVTENATEAQITAVDDAQAHQSQVNVSGTSDQQMNQSGSARTSFNLTWVSSEPIPIDTQTRQMLESILRQIEADEKNEIDGKLH